MKREEFFMREALNEAMKAAQMNEVPVGAIIVQGDRIVGRGFNTRETSKNALAHAEIIAIDNACKTLNGWRLVDCEMFVTLEPCIMCAGAIYQSRIVNLFYGARDFKAGAFGSIYDLSKDDRLNHQVQTVPGVLEEECVLLLKSFFKKLREQK